jgi:hypothetical protein
MASNDLFRMVSLRHSKTSGSGGARSLGPDPRLRHRDLVEGRPDLTSSLRDTKLRDLKDHHANLSKKLVRLESVKRAVIDAYMLERRDESVPSRVPTRRSTNSERSASGSIESGGSGSTMIRDQDGFLGRVEARLNEREAEVFRDVIASVPGETHRDLADFLNVLAVGSIMDEANMLCSQIQAVEENVSEGLPTIRVEPVPGSDPIVAAVGWGDLIVARETLVGYEAREIAHIENILPGETKLREHQRVSKTEEVQETETITEKESEKDSQTTDRYELQAESQETINRDFSISTGVNTSGQYGLTHVDTSLDAAFSQSQSQSRSSSINTAREIVTKAVERTFERVRRFRRLTITEEIRELNRHDLTNAGGSGNPTAISGIYLWVEKIQKVELRHYGTRMMVEFHVPEPAVSLLERSQVSNAKKKLPPFDISPAGIQPGNYMCLAQRFGAMDVEPPPTLLIEVGYGWVSKIKESDEAYGEDQFTDMINIPAGYRPTWAKVAWSGLRGKDENLEFNFAFSVAGKSQGIEHTVTTYDGVVLRLAGDSDWPQGVPVSGRVHGSWDGAMYVQVNMSCVRTAEALDAWRLRTWEALRVGYEALERKASQENQREDYQRNLLGPAVTEGPSSENRRIERAELQKWAIKSMRLAPQNFNAIEQIGEFQEMSPVNAEAQAPIVRFYEDAFEWEHMNYFLYPYHWARRASWRMRTDAQAVDRQYQAFLEAGAARVIVPVTPGFEDKVAWFLDPQNAAAGELERILAPPPTTTPASSSDAFRDLWVELFTERKPDVARGSGTLKVQSGNAEVRINPQTNPNTQWSVSEELDMGRELYIAGNRYVVSAVANENTFSLDRPYEGANDALAVYVTGSTPFGPPWTVNVPTSLIVLAENVPALKTV